MADHPLYNETAGCFDLPELELEGNDGPVMALPELDPEVVIAAVSARQVRGGRLEEKVDGCWLCMKITSAGHLTDPRSRASIRNRFAADWIGAPVSVRFAGWAIVGEIEAGTQRARMRREELEHRGYYGRPPIWVYALVTPDKEVITGDRCAALVTQLAPLELHGRLRAVRAALPGEDWGEFTRRVLEAGGEGVVIRDADGRCWRAKGQRDVDRYCSRVVTEPDSAGRRRTKAILSVCTSAGKRARFREVQRVVLPNGLRKADVEKKVVTIVGSELDKKTGVVRHARIVDVREDKPATACKIAA